MLTFVKRLLVWRQISNFRVMWINNTKKRMRKGEKRRENVKEKGKTEKKE
jgi:hypothetical protein